jgi:hypothetical protein
MVAAAERALRVVVGRRNEVAKVTKFAISSKRVPVIRGKSVHLSTSKRISLELNHPEEQRHVHHQGATKMIRGRKCPRKKWPKPHVSIMPRESADVVTNVFINMMTKLPLPPKIPKGPIHPLPKRRARIPQPLRA